MADSGKCSGEIVSRLARESDFQAILEISEGLYDGRDYLPNVFFQWLNDANRYIIIAEMESKVIGLSVLHVVDAGKTIVHQAMRIHPKYRGQNLGTKFSQRIEQYTREHFPTVEIERLVAGSYSPMAQAMAKRLSFEPFRSFNSCELPIQCDTFLTFQETFLTSKVFKFMTKGEFENLIVQNTYTGKLNGVIAKNTFVIQYYPYDVLPSNCSNGLLEKQDCFYVHTNADTKAIQSLSHGRMVPKVKCMNWLATIYTSDAELLRIHIAKQLKSAILQSKGKSFVFHCFFYHFLTSSAKLFFQNELLMKKNEIKFMDIIVYQKIVNKQFDSKL